MRGIAKLLLSLFFWAFSFSATAQKAYWENASCDFSFSCKGKASLVLDNNDILFLGNRADGNGNNSIVLTRLSSSGSLLNMHTLVLGSGVYGEHMVAVNKSVAALVGGESAASIENKGFISLLDTSGNILKQASISDSVKAISLKHIQCTSDKGFIACGYITQEDFSANDFFVVKLDSSLNVKWTKTLGFSDNDYAQMIRQTAEGDYIVSGDTRQLATDYDNYLVKLDSEGNIIWDIVVGDANVNGNQALIIDKNGDYVLSGESTKALSLLFDVYLVKVRKNGILTWANYIGKEGSEAGFSLIQDAHSDFIIAGYSSSYGSSKPINPFLLRTDSAGNSKGVNYFTHNGIGIAYDIQAYKEGYLISGVSNDSAYIAYVSDSLYEDDFTTTTQVAELRLKQSEIYVYPQPASSTDEITIHSANRIESVELYDITGRLIWKDFFTGVIAKIPENVMKQGVYVLNVYTNKGLEIVKLVIN